MQNHQSILTLLHAIVAGLFGLAASSHDYFMDTFKDHGNAGNVVFVAALLILFYLFRESGRITTILIEKIPGVSPALRRVMMGKSCIEGDWPLVVLDDGKRAVRYLGFLTIGYENGQFTVKGTDWSPEGTHAHNFESQQSRFSENLLQYWYKQGKNDTMRGYTEINFFPEGEHAGRLAGKFLDENHNSSRFYARRRHYTYIERRRLSEDQKIAEAGKVWASIETKLDRVANRDISADWE